MPKFLFSYRVPQDYRPGQETGQAWQAWFDSLGSSLTDLGHGVLGTRALGKLDDGIRLGGYSVVTAEDMDSAVTLAKGCPALQFGGGVEIGAAMHNPRAPIP